MTQRNSKTKIIIASQCNTQNIRMTHNTKSSNSNAMPSRNLVSLKNANKNHSNARSTKKQVSSSCSSCRAISSSMAQ